MIRARLNTINFFLRVTTLLLPSLASAITGYVRFESGLIPIVTKDIDLVSYVLMLLFTTVVWGVAAEHYGLYRFDILFEPRSSAKTAAWTCASTYVVVMGATFFYRSVSFSRVFVALSAVALFALAVATRQAARSFLVWARQKEGARPRVLIVGADQFAEQKAREVLERMVMPCTVVGFVRLPEQEVAVQGYPVFELGEREIQDLRTEIDDVIIALPLARFGELPAIQEKLEPLCVPVRAILDLGKGVVIRDALFDFEGIPMVDLRATPSESVMYMIAKRGFDLVFSILGLVLSAPLMALSALAIWIESRGPVFFKQDRVGLNGRIFRMYKFRTMRPGDRAESDTRWTTHDDSRRTRVGAFLRRTNLDELLQFFNVLKGDMSVVGPRPERPHFVEKFVRELAQYNTRHYLKVGMTGWAQVNGWRGDTSIARRVEHDIYYLRNWSLLLDLRIIFLTVWRTISANKNAY